MEFLNSISGLNAAYANINIIGNNITNAFTIGFKSHHLLFKDLFSSSYNNQKNPGIGVKISKIIQNFNDGEKVNTQNAMDVSINKHGFFKFQDSTGNIFYSRNGHLIIDKNNNITNLHGMYLIGYKPNQYTNNIELKSQPGIINFKHLKYLPFKPTSEVIIKNIFNTQAPLKLIKNFNPFNAKSYNIKITTKVYDLFKKSQKIHLFFLKKDNLNWIMKVMNNNNTKDIKSYKLKFDNEGKLKTNSIKTVYTYFINSKKKQLIRLNLRKIIQKNVKTETYLPTIQNGHLEGIIKGLFIDTNGVILGKYSNNKTLKLGQIALYDTLSKENLKLEYNNMWSVPTQLPMYKKGIPGDSYFKKLSIGCLENSNVDLNQELTNIIIAQRNYQSNVQMIKTQDKILHTLINSK